jgi:hypothetical protein
VVILKIAKKWMLLGTVLALSIILFLFLLPAPHTEPDCARFTATQSDLKYIALAFFPNEFEVGFELREEELANLKKKGLTVLKDRWGEGFVYIGSTTNGSSKPLLYSLGKNKVDDAGGKDDIVINRFINKDMYCNENQ